MDWNLTHFDPWIKNFIIQKSKKRFKVRFIWLIKLNVLHNLRYGLFVHVGLQDFPLAAKNAVENCFNLILVLDSC